MADSGFVTQHGDWECAHNDAECPLGEITVLIYHYPSHSKTRAALERIVNDALDSDGDDQSPTYCCHYCGAEAYQTEDEDVGDEELTDETT